MSPAERDEVVRFGIHDEEAFRELASRAGDIAGCESCGRRAAYAGSMACCPATSLICADCLPRARSSIEARLLVLNLLGESAVCQACRHEFAAPAVFEDLYSVVEL
ncbi:MAG: hypothetical protein K0R60_51 [Microbacterium sp.]|jgi:hypothetical protein|nr:hypothetical protein [Microbacterium sp.]